ncbi:MAG: archease [bacterium]
MTTRWEHFDHQADIGIRGYGPTVEAAFEQAGLAVTSVMVPVERVAEDSLIVVQCEAPDLELLLVDWLNGILREMSAKRMVFSRFHVTLDGTRLRGELWGELINSQRHEPSGEVKGASYYEARVWQDEDGGWVAQCVVDV